MISIFAVEAVRYAVPDFYATIRVGEGIDVTVRPESRLRDDLDFVRVLEDDGDYRVLHLTHNEVLRGEVRLSGSLTGMLSTVVGEIIEGF